ncbi:MULTISPECIES: type IV secretion system protein [Fusobacterium]|jgi:trbL/virB6 plasmid conjugal transfer protein|uniref:P-type conjugative transfer protein TrbL n=1 Tax=Fusobacterium vincentii 4_1_13 TaxID=469606 RepID=A0A0M1VUK2_FUSVC|nr:MULTISPECIES: type IV secretion system protein [Fusobacterium]EEO40300.1 P-type conjugative transfer protein TrbL [Fusobacterium vincentii 4_1_13]ERT34885.1 P-type conjugative transfer protein TrbL [Fusobacterium nucleatum CTI-3]EUB35052.1 putative P-type conjugative transfer protein TrbL [Fusobacterium sp. CM1]
MLGIDANAILTATKAFAEGMIKNLNPTVMNLLSSFLIIDLTLSFLFDESEGLNIFIKLIKKVLYYGFFIWIIQEYGTLIFENLMGGAIQLGNVAAGKGSSTEINVELLEKFGIDASDIAGLMAAGAGSVILDIFGVEAMATVMLLAAVGYLMFFVMLYVQILVTFVKFYLIAGYAYILIPFGVLNKTKDIALKALNGLFSQAIEIFVLIVILNLAVFIQETKWSSIISLPMNSLEAIKANLFTKFAILMFLYLLINKAGSIASSLLSGAIASIGIGAEAGARGFNNAMSAPGKVAGGMTDRASAYQKRDDGATGGAKAFRDGSRAAGAYTRAANFIKGKFKNSGSNGSNSGTTN